jgi:hypothetical protein
LVSGKAKYFLFRGLTWIPKTRIDLPVGRAGRLWTPASMVMQVLTSGFRLGGGRVLPHRSEMNSAAEASRTASSGIAVTAKIPILA